MKLKLVTFLIFVVASTLAFFYYSPKVDHYAIKPAASFLEANDSISKADSETVITFDVDDTLIATNDALINGMPYPLMFRLKAAFKYPAMLKKDKWECVASTMYAQAHFFIIEPVVVLLIKQLQERGCKVIALTSMETGSYGIIPSLEEWRANMLRGFGIDFSDSFENASLSDVPSYRGNHPRFYKGILCANQQNKGRVLGALLDCLKLRPRNIISFDDDLEALKSIAQMCADRKISFVGYKYLGAKKAKEKWDAKEAFTELDRIMAIAC